MTSYPYVPENRNERRVLLVEYLRKYSYKKIHCPALGVKVRIYPESIQETAWHASKSVISTKLALRMPYVIHNAKIYQQHIKPKETKQTKVFHFRELVVLVCGIRGLGTARLTVGIKFKKFVVEYCITDFHCEK